MSFAYSNTPNAANDIYTMTDGNSAPALAVWLFLVTNTYFNNEIAKIPSNKYDKDLIPIDKIAQYTGLTEDAVEEIFSCYFNGTVAQQVAFGTVANAFQAFAANHAINYQPNNCIATADPILNLASHGADVDPTAALAPQL